MSIHRIQQQTRRHFFQQSAAGIGAAALGSLLADASAQTSGAENPLAAAETALCPAGETSHLSTHDRFASEPGPV